MPELLLSQQNETFKRELSETTREYSRRGKELLKKIDDMVAGKTISKKEMAVFRHDLEVMVTNMPIAMRFVESQFAEQVEKTTQAAKSEIEAFVVNTATRMGIDLMQMQANSPALPAETKKCSVTVKPSLKEHYKGVGTPPCPSDFSEGLSNCD